MKKNEEWEKARRRRKRRNRDHIQPANLTYLLFGSLQTNLPTPGLEERIYDLKSDS